MPRFIIDVNLPYRFGLWRGPEYEHMRDIDERMPDARIWEYARVRDIVIVTKDADFSVRMLLSAPPPRVVHIRLGNVSLRGLHHRLADAWPWVVANAAQYSLITIWPDRVEAITSPQ